ncbi:exodeoxyribonuclease V alpha subunit [Paraglaciecola arctica BSs20135]|uniref:Exodeoxyribonuclease V alpha subunit n=1 Tax=Paraglaciecola arctica BSs20135 TaxID=493475 RepID=K6YLH3_9ALTE|nr:exodeoxyribonuclease V alpha subunit [Paraglaciecola arctica BSs20135]
MLGKFSQEQVFRDMADGNAYEQTKITCDIAHKVSIELPITGEEFIRFIAKTKDFEGIGDVYARRLWDKFKQRLYILLDKKETTELESVLTNKQIAGLQKGYEKYENLKFANYLASKHIHPTITQRLFKYHKKDSIEAIKKNPHILVEFGMTFSEADELAKREFKVAKDSLGRLIGAVGHVMRAEVNDKGHTVATHGDIYEKVKELLKNKTTGDEDNDCHDLAAQALQIAGKNLCYYLNPLTGHYHYTPTFLMEQVIAKRLLKLNAKKTLFDERVATAVNWAIESEPLPLEEKQVEAIFSAHEHNVSCIIGGAGTGKTTVLRTVLKAYELLGYNIKAVALSGKAAMRLHQSIGLQTSTIARLLREDPLVCPNDTVVVIDEASMVDIASMYQIINHISPHVRLILIGDPAQLPPIGAGLLLADMLKSNVIECVELDVVKRQKESTGIIEYSAEIRAGIIPSELTKNNIKFNNVYAKNIVETCALLFSESSVETKIIAATNPMVKNINKLVQETVNSCGKEMMVSIENEYQKSGLRLNDPILFIKNNQEKGIQNGSFGRLVAITHKSADKFGVVRIDDTNEKIDIDLDLLDSMRLGYSMTVHKAQGSQFSNVIIALSSRYIKRDWFYTAITRAENSVEIVGTAKQFEDAVTREAESDTRKTYLSELLK